MACPESILLGCRCGERGRWHTTATSLGLVGGRWRGGVGARSVWLSTRSRQRPGWAWRCRSFARRARLAAWLGPTSRLYLGASTVGGDVLPRAGRLGRLRKDGGGVGLGIRAGGVLPAAVSRSLLAGTVEPARVALDVGAPATVRGARGRCLALCFECLDLERGKGAFAFSHSTFRARPARSRAQYGRIRHLALTPNVTQVSSISM